MTILIVHGPQIRNYPPVRSLVLNLLNNGNKVVLLTRGLDKTDLSDNPNLRCIEIPNSEYKSSKIAYPFQYISKKKKMREIIQKEMEHCDLIWTTTDTTVRDIGPLLFQYRHIMQLMELIEDIPAIPRQTLLKYNIKRYAAKADKVVVPEFNRAYIQKVWWKLKNLPIVLPNKPYDMPIIDNVTDDIRRTIEEMEENKKNIVLYQGGFEKDRNLDIIAAAIGTASEEFDFYIMGKDNDDRKELSKRFPYIKYIPFVNPPYHLAITSKADIGVLPYFPNRTAHLSVLNAVFCAPNKTFEYAAFGLPMLGTNVPGLVDVFQKYDIGYNYDENDSSEVIIDLLRKIKQRHEIMSNNCKEYFDSVNLDSIVNGIIH